MTPIDENTVGDTTQDRLQLWTLIENIRFCMLTTRHHDGHLHSRPITTQNSKLDEDSSLWFFLAGDSEAVADLKTDPIVNVAYADPQDDRYVSISGHSSVVEDMGKKYQLWSKKAQAWFPKGATDPNLALVEVKIIYAHYWNYHENKIVQLFHRTKAAITGQQSSECGEQGELHLG